MAVGMKEEGPSRHNLTRESFSGPGSLSTSPPARAHCEMILYCHKTLTPGHHHHHYMLSLQQIDTFFMIILKQV